MMKPLRIYYTPSRIFMYIYLVSMYRWILVDRFVFAAYRNDHRSKKKKNFQHKFTYRYECAGNGKYYNVWT